MAGRSSIEEDTLLNVILSLEYHRVQSLKLYSIFCFILTSSITYNGRKPSVIGYAGHQCLPHGIHFHPTSSSSFELPR